MKNDDSNSNGTWSGQNGENNVNGYVDTHHAGDKIARPTTPTKRLVSKSTRKVEKLGGIWA
jgi:hypothetical protein